MGIFTRRKDKPANEQRIDEPMFMSANAINATGRYSHSFEDLEEGYEEVYEPLYAFRFADTVLTEHGYELVLFRWLEEDEGGEPLAPAAEPVLKFLETAKRNGRPTAFRRFLHTPEIAADQAALGELDRQIRTLAREEES